MSAGSASAEGKISEGGMVSQLKKQSSKHIKQITEDCKSNLEHQGILIGEIAKYGRLRKSIGGSSVSAAMAESKKEKGNKDFGVVEDVTLERWMWSFKKWGPSVIHHFAMFCDESMRAYSTCKLWGQKDVTQQILEYAFDIQVSGTEVDFAMKVNLRECFQEIKKAYDSKGKRLQNLTPVVASGAVEWSVYGHYEVKADGEKIILSNRRSARTLTSLSDLVAGLGVKDTRLSMHWSQTEASLIMKTDSVKCASFFPTPRWPLKRAASNEDPALVGRAKHQLRMQTLQEQEKAAKQAKPADKRPRHSGSSVVGSWSGLGEVAEELDDPGALLAGQ